MSWAMVNGRLMPLADARIPVDDVGFTLGWTVFETLRVVDGEVPLLSEHLARLESSALAAEIPMVPLQHEVESLAAKTIGVYRIRVTLSGSGLRVLTIEPVPEGRRGASVRCVTGPAVSSPLLSGAVKHGSRAAWVSAVKRARVDDLLLVDEAGRFTEATTAAIVAVVAGRLQTAPFDGRILQSTTLVELLERADRLQIPVDRVGALAAGPWDGLYVASATRGLAPVVELDGRPLPGWEPVGRALFSAL